MNIHLWAIVVGIYVMKYPQFIPRLNTEVYWGLDVGAVYGKSTEALVGKTIAGTALGVRGNYASGLLFDAFVSTPFIIKPQGYHTKKVFIADLL